MSVTIPEKFLSLIEEAKGSAFKNEITESILAQDFSTSIRLNKSKTFDSESILKDVDFVPWCSMGRYLKERPVFTLDPLFHAGAYYVQEASSMLLEKVWKQLSLNTESKLILDLCAAPGGKSTHLLSLMDDFDFLVANEVIQSRAQILKENIIKWGDARVAITNADPEHFAAFKRMFDVVVCDAPCSGEGLFRRDMNAMTEWSFDNVMLCAGRQKRILHEAWELVKPGGYLIYSTCTFNQYEDEENVKWLLDEFEGTSVELDELDNGVELVNIDGVFGYKCFPNKVKGEGFFISAIQKKEQDSIVTSKIKVKKQVFESPKSEELKLIQNLIAEDLDVVKFNEKLLAIPPLYKEFINHLGQKLRIVYTGVLVGEIIKNKFNPSEFLAFSNHLNKSFFNSIELNNIEDALAFLKKEGFVLPEGSQSGWVLITYNGFGLGFVKNMGNRFNNYYPNEWRIRMNL